VEECGRGGQATDDNIIACRITKARIQTHTHTDTQTHTQNT